MNLVVFSRVSVKSLLIGLVVLAIYSITGCGVSYTSSEKAAADDSAPSVFCSAIPATVVSGKTAQISTIAVSPINLPLTYSYAATAGTLTNQGASATLNTQGASGNIAVNCKAADTKGNSTSYTTTLVVQPISPQAPKISCSANPSTVMQGGNVALTAVASSPTGSPLSYTWTASSGTISGKGNTATLNTSSAAAGTITVSCTAADNQGLTASATTSVNVTVASVSAPPTISCSANPATVTEDSNVLLTALATSPEGRPLTYTWSASSGTISGSGNTATLNTTGAAAGSITVTCSVADNQGLTATATAVVTVTSPPSSAPPTISCSVNPASVIQGGTVALTAVGNSPEGRPLTYTWSASSGSITSNGNTATLNTTGAAAGTITVTCKATDSQSLTASATTVLTVTAAGPPTISCSANPSSLVQGGSTTITATASSPEGRPLTYTWSASSGSITGNGNTATLNTTGAATGTITVTCNVADNQGLTAFATTSVAVTTPASGIEPAQCVPPTITQPAPIVHTPIAPPTGSYINVMQNGATGDGHTNDSPALQSIINANPNAVIFFPAGQYVLDNPNPNQAGLLFSGFQGTAIMASGASFLCDTATTSAGQCIEILNSSGASFDNFTVGYVDQSSLPLPRTDSISNGILVQSSSSLNFANTTVEASTGSGIWVTNSTNISFLGGTSVSNTTADGLHFENVGNGTVVGYTAQNTGDDSLASTNIDLSANANCGLNASNIQISQSHSRGIAVAGGCGASFSNFYINDTSNSGLGIVQDSTIDSRVPNNNSFSNGAIVNAGRYSGIAGSKDCIDIALSTATNVSNVECLTPMNDGLFVFNAADQVTVSGVTVDAAANVGLQPTQATNVSMSNTVSRNSVNAGYAIQNVQGGSMVGATTCSSGSYGFYHSTATNFTESNLTSYDSDESSPYRVWWAENSSSSISVNGIDVLDDKTHPSPDVIGGAGDPSGSITVDSVSEDLLGTTLSMQLP
jgi:hypothetical protein